MSPAAFLPPMFSLRFLLLGGLVFLPASRSALVGAEATVAAPRTGNIHRFITLPGTLRAEQQVTLHAKVAGYLKSITVEKGDRVKTGQVLAELEMPELLAERARHEAELKIARAESERIAAARTKAPDLITPQALDAADARLAKAEAILAHHESLLRYGRIAAPFSGVVTMRYVDPGAFVPAATASGNPAAAAIVTLMDYSVVRAQVAVPEIEAAKVRAGQPVLLTSESFPGRTFRGTVSRHAGALDEATRSLLVEADFPNQELELRPGMYVTVKLGVEERQGVLLVPAAAVVREKTSAHLFTLVDGKAVRVPVKTGFNDGNHVEITEGLERGAGVLVPGKTPLVSGQPVTAVEAK